MSVSSSRGREGQGGVTFLLCLLQVTFIEGIFLHETFNVCSKIVLDSSVGVGRRPSDP